MSLLMWGILILFLCPNSKEVVSVNTRPARWHLRQMEKEHNIVRNFKRHSDGTFSSDFTQFMDKIKAKSFVEWLANTKKDGCAEDVQQYISK